jgi:hypothetical protein
MRGVSSQKLAGYEGWHLNFGVFLLVIADLETAKAVRPPEVAPSSFASAGSM